MLGSSIQVGEDNTFITIQEDWFIHFDLEMKMIHFFSFFNMWIRISLTSKLNQIKIVIFEIWTKILKIRPTKFNSIFWVKPKKR